MTDTRIPDTMVERLAHAAENAVFNPRAHGCSVSIIGDARLFYVELALAALRTLRDPTEAMIRAAGDGPADRSCWQRIIDAALSEPMP